MGSGWLCGGPAASAEIQAEASGEATRSGSLPAGLYDFMWRATRRLQIPVCLLGALTAVLVFAPLEVQRRIVNGALVQGDLNQLVMLCGAYLVLIIVQNAVKYVLNVWRGGLVETATLLLRRLTYHGAEADDAPSGTLVSILASETEDVGGFVAEALSTPLVQGGTILVTVGYLLWVQPLIAALATLVYLPQLLFVPVLQDRINMAVLLHARLVRRLGNRVVTLQRSGERPPTDAGFDRLARYAYAVRMRIYSLKYLVTFLGNLLDALGPLTVLLVGGWLVIEGRTEIGTLVVFISGFQKIGDPLDQLVTYYRMASNARVKYALIRTTIQPAAA